MSSAGRSNCRRTGWSLTKIGRFYNGRHHTTVLYGIGKIERLRKTDEAFDALMDVLAATVAAEGNRGPAVSAAHSELIEAVALRVIQRLKEQPVDRRTIQAATLIDVSPTGASNG